jgi:hypothetical protein
MKCDRCNKEDLPQKRRMVGRGGPGIPIQHHECESGHRWHLPVASGPETRQTLCDCPNLEGPR